MKPEAKRRKALTKKRLIKIAVRWTALFVCLFSLFQVGSYVVEKLFYSSTAPQVKQDALVVSKAVEVPTVIQYTPKPKVAVQKENVAQKQESATKNVAYIDTTTFRGWKASPVYDMSVKLGATSTAALQIAKAYATCGTGSIPPEIVVGVIATESGFNPLDVSYAGAKGIMQLLPDTFFYYTNQYPKLFPKKDIFDVYENVCAGILYLQDSYEAWASHTASKAEVLDLAIGSYLMGVQGLKNLSDSPTKAVTNDNYFVSEYVRRVKTYAGTVDSIR